MTQPDVPQPAPQYPYGQPAANQPAVPPYGQPQPYGYGEPYTVRPTNNLAIISLVLSLAGFAIPGGTIGGIITGHIALGQIKRSGEGGRGLALAGVIIGYVVTGGAVLGIIIYFVVIAITFGALAATTGSY